MPRDVNERTALITRQPPHDIHEPRTPLPVLQLSIVLLMQLSEPIASQSIFPYINQLVSELDITGGDKKKVGYYAGLESLFFLTQAMTVLQWSRTSDRIGRKPVLLMGLLGTAASIYCFGLSRTFWTLVVSRCLSGLLNGNVGVMKSTMGDLTDRTNRADAFAFLPIIWAMGASIGPLIGGSLARPHSRFPEAFSSPFWVEFPYFLPCLVTGSFVLFCAFVALLFFKETVPAWKPVSAECGSKPSGPRSFGDLLASRNILLSIGNYVTLAYLNTTHLALLPLFLSMPIEIGGLGLHPPTIGLIMSIYGATSGTFQVLFFARLIRRFGEGRIFMLGISTCPLVFALYPLMSAIAQRRSDLNHLIWVLMGLLIALSALMETAFGAVFMFMTASAPKSSRGTVNGLAQTSVALARALGPAMSTALFSLSVQHDLLGGRMVYAVYIVLAGGAILFGAQLPERSWDDIE
ncbi:major facilitator superfamily transporter [Roridomyces roridus]|uniref:Major facilitator superfamily transporter n=1 Tax=Roridomyces roridus TaxID=1738132 RepID=A0AAD7G2K5_9AGAR|nr:major facilitator superfamily transporter [Roridomyces roridus]